MSRLLDWLSSLPPTALYLVLAVTAAAENIFPPLPADTVVALGSWLSARGIRFEGQLSAILVLYETKKIFGTRTSERFGPSAALFDLALVRFLEHDARAEAVETLEGVTQRVHDEYERRLATLRRVGTS